MLLVGHCQSIPVNLLSWLDCVVIPTYRSTWLNYLLAPSVLVLCMLLPLRHWGLDYQHYPYSKWQSVWMPFRPDFTVRFHLSCITDSLDPATDGRRLATLLHNNIDFFYRQNLQHDSAIPGPKSEKLTSFKLLIKCAVTLEWKKFNWIRIYYY